MKVLIVGCGNQGCLADAPGTGNEKKVISFAHAFKEKDANLVFWDICNRKAHDAFGIWGGMAATIRHACGEWTYDGIGVDIVVVASTDNTHYEVLKEITKYKHPQLVICEKPLCNTYKEAYEIVDLYKKLGIPLLVNYTRRFVPELRDLKSRYKDGKFGKCIKSTIFFNRGVEHTFSHAVDFICWFFDGRFLPDGTIDVREFTDIDYRIWQLQLFFEKFFWQEQRIFNMPVPSYFDLSTRYVVSNAYNFLGGTEELICSGEDALNSLEIISFMKGAK